MQKGNEMPQLGRRCLFVPSVVSLVSFTAMEASADKASLTADVATLASEAFAGRVPGSTGIDALNYIRARLESAGYREEDGRIIPFAIGGGGTNLLALLPGTGSLASEYVLVGAHYDHVASCPEEDAEAGDVSCNGATDNAAGVAILLEIADQLSRTPPATRRGIYLAFWDREEEQLVGSVAHRIATPPPYWPQPVAYVNYDIQGANLSGALRSTTFAIGASSGGTRLVSAVNAAAAPEGEPLRVRHLTELFGMYRSDYATFVAPKVVNKIRPDLPAGLPRVPTVFFTDSSGPCYHTPDDELAIMDGSKLERQARIGVRLVRDLATGTKPSIQALPLNASTFSALVGPFVGPAVGITAPYPPVPPPTFADAVELLTVARLAADDVSLDLGIRAAIGDQLPPLQQIVDRGFLGYRALIDGATVATVALSTIPVLEDGVCQSFVPQ
jgi:Peptidase family M28